MAGRRLNIPRGYSVGNARGGFTFTWRVSDGVWRQATAEDGAPFITLDALEAAIQDHHRQRQPGEG